jgi:hypothetical protein
MSMKGMLCDTVLDPSCDMPLVCVCVCVCVCCEIVCSQDHELVFDMSRRV